MKILIGTVLALCMFALARPPVANVADVDWLGRLSILGGAESESAKRKDAWAGNAGGIYNAEVLAVVPVTPYLGIQLQGNYQRSGADASNRIGVQAGPILGWSGGILGSGGKAGVFLADQFRSYVSNHDGDPRNGNFFWLRPSVSLYDLFPNTNTDVWWSQPMSPKINRIDGKFGDCCPRHLIPYSQVRAAVNWFPAGIPFTTKDNAELTFGIQFNGYSGTGSNRVQSGVGPVFGAAIMPWQNVEVQLFKAAIDNQNRYRVTSGIQVYFDTSKSSTLLQLRRKYLEPTNLPGSVTSWHRF
jgi:hypothetical protein